MANSVQQGLKGPATFVTRYVDAHNLKSSLHLSHFRRRITVFFINNSWVSIRSLWWYHNFNVKFQHLRKPAFETWNRAPLVTVISLGSFHSDAGSSASSYLDGELEILDCGDFSVTSYGRRELMILAISGPVILRDRLRLICRIANEFKKIPSKQEFFGPSAGMLGTKT